MSRNIEAVTADVQTTIDHLAVLRAEAEENARWCSEQIPKQDTKADYFRKVTERNAWKTLVRRIQQGVNR